MIIFACKALPYIKVNSNFLQDEGVENELIIDFTKIKIKTFIFDF